jgi:hypothetical protein
MIKKSGKQELIPRSIKLKLQIEQLSTKYIKFESEIKSLCFTHKNNIKTICIKYNYINNIDRITSLNDFTISNSREVYHLIIKTQNIDNIIKARNDISDYYKKCKFVQNEFNKDNIFNKNITTCGPFRTHITKLSRVGILRFVCDITTINQYFKKIMDLLTTYIDNNLIELKNTKKENTINPGNVPRWINWDEITNIDKTINKY